MGLATPISPAQSRMWALLGPRLWAELHLWALGAELRSAADWLQSFDRRIGCGSCRADWKRWVEAHPPALTTHESLFAWTVEAHNDVNRRLGKPELPVGAALARWRQVAAQRGPSPVARVPRPAPPTDGRASDVPRRPASPGPLVNCVHASVPLDGVHSKVTCALHLFGGTPHAAMCADCRRREPVDPTAPAVDLSNRMPEGRLRVSQPPPSRAAKRLVGGGGSADGKNGKDVRGNLLLRTHLSPGDILMLTAAVRDLHRAHPGWYRTAVETSASALWDNNPYVEALPQDRASWRVIDMHYPLVNHSNQRPVHFVEGYAHYLSEQLGVHIPTTELKGDVHLAEDEMRWVNQVRERFGFNGRFWIMMAGGKYDFTTKWWPPAYYQRVVDHFMGRLQFVQCGERHHWHTPLRGVFNLVGQTSLRQFVRLMYHAEGVVCPVTFAMHLAAAVPSRSPRLRPCVVIAGGREPPHWEAYPGHQYLHTIGALPCCANGGCWRSRCQLVGDGDRKDRENLCERPVQFSEELRVPQCMAMVQPEDVIRGIERALAFDTFRA